MWHFYNIKKDNDIPFGTPLSHIDNYYSTFHFSVKVVLQRPKKIKCIGFTALLQQLHKILRRYRLGIIIALIVGCIIRAQENTQLLIFHTFDASL